jgi:Heat induced stress protein YflT
MATTPRSLIVGVFTDGVQADLALDQLQQEGFNSDLLSLSHQQGGRSGVKNLFSKLPEQQGSIVDELKRLGLPEEEARYYQNELDAGRIIVTVQADGRQQDAREILESNGAYDIHTRPETKNPS